MTPRVLRTVPAARPHRALRLSRLPGLALALASLALGCSSESPTEETPVVPFAPSSPWPKFRADAAQTGRSTLGPAGAANGAGGRLWEVKTEKGIFSSPVIGADGTTYIGSADRTFYAIANDGTVRWKALTGEIIDSAALLDDRGRVYFGSGDGKLRALDAATGSPVWTMEADDPATTKAFIRWFEGNVAMSRDGTLLVPNDNFFVYAVDRDTGAVRWRARMPDQTWSSPAVDPADDFLFLGNNNVVPILGKNTFAIASDGSMAWGESSLGSVAASPMIVGDRIVVGSFDGFVRAYSKSTGALLWETGTRDHIYASPALLPDGTIVQPSADGTVYALDADNGAVRWTFDTDDPIRSSPAVDAEGNIYFGGGDGKLWAIRADGSLRWAMRLVEGDRNDLNASPALGKDGIVIAGESGQIFGVPWDYCLRDEARSDGRCTTSTPERSAGGASLRYITAMGATLDGLPAEVDGNEGLTFRLDARDEARSLLATLDAPSVQVTTNPPVEVDVRVAGDGKFVTIAPRTSWPARTELSIRAAWLRDHAREGLRLTGGVRGGDVATTVNVASRARGQAAVAAPGAAGDAGTTWELARLALPLPTLMPSYNQIGFDSLHWLVGVVEKQGDHGVAWMIGAKLPEGDNHAVVDPATRALFPLEMRTEGDLVTFASSETLRVEVMNVVVPFDAFRISTRLLGAGGQDGLPPNAAKLSGSTVCATVPFYGQFLQKLGLCNPQTDQLVVVGGAELRPRQAGANAAGDAQGRTGEAKSGRSLSVDTVSVAREGDAVRAKLAGSRVRAADHVVSVLLVDAATGKPVTLDYGVTTQRETDAEGNVVSVVVPLGGRPMPAKVRAHLLVDTRLLGTQTVQF
jgi:outer membrane protein assembly factor BamB